MLSRHFKRKQLSCMLTVFFYTNIIFYFNKDTFKDLKKHKTSIHDPGKKVLECALCQIGFNCIEDYNVHIKTMKHGKMKISCDYCQKLMSVHYYRQHVLTNHSSLHVCNTCDEKFDNKRVSFNHLHLNSFKIRRKGGGSLYYL